MSRRTAAAKKAMKRTRRATTNVFSTFEQSQIEEFKEAFNFIDQNKDGIIDQEDLKDMFASLGKDVTDGYVTDMLREAPTGINFTMFLTLIAQKMGEVRTDDTRTLHNAFFVLDEDRDGLIDAEELKTMLTTRGNKMSEEDVDTIFKDVSIKNGKIDYREFTRVIKGGNLDKDNQ